MPGQPIDEWDFVRTESDDDRDDVHAPEDLAVHLEPDDPRRGADDPARRDEGVDVDDGDDGPVEDHFPDEEPERAAWRPEPEHEPDLEEILESQHYAFPDEGDDGDG